MKWPNNYKKNKRKKMIPKIYFNQIGVVTDFIITVLHGCCFWWAFNTLDIDGTTA